MGREPDARGRARGSGWSGCGGCSGRSATLRRPTRPSTSSGTNGKSTATRAIESLLLGYGAFGRLDHLSARALVG